VNRYYVHDCEGEEEIIGRIDRRKRGRERKKNRRWGSEGKNCLLLVQFNKCRRGGGGKNLPNTLSTDGPLSLLLYP
jgi:hypothetical protein